MSEHLFVYGTLMRGSGHAAHRLLSPHTEYACEGYFVGRLYRVIDYPAAVASFDPDDRVFGELYRLIDAKALFVALDDYEGEKFARRRMQIYRLAGVATQAWIYLFIGSQEGLQRIASGRFEQRKAGQE